MWNRNVGHWQMYAYKDYDNVSVKLAPEEWTFEKSAII